MESYNKLVRDGIPQILDEKGIPYERRTATPEEYRLELIKKLLEEAAELATSGTPEELADVIEVIGALKKLPEFAEVEAIRARKLQERGGFEERIILKGEK